MEDKNLRIIERTFHTGEVRYIIQKHYNFFGWRKWVDVSWESYDTEEEAEKHIVDWFPKPKPVDKIVKVY